MVKASTLQSVGLGFVLFVESYQKTLKNGIHSFLAWHLAFKGSCGEQVGLLCPWARHLRDAPIFVWKTGGPDSSEIENYQASADIVSKI